jgi:two-component system chemotaxis sensor kinase CheA
VRLADSLRQLMAIPDGAGPEAGFSEEAAAGPGAASRSADEGGTPRLLPWGVVPEAERAAWLDAAVHGTPRFWVVYTPAVDSFFKGEDPFHQARQTPGVVWHRISADAPWPPPAELDPYQCVLRFDLVTAASRAELDEHFRYVPEQVAIVALTPEVLQSAASPAAASRPPTSIVDAILAAQLTALQQPDAVAWLPGRLRGIASTLAACYRSIGRAGLLPALDAALASALSVAGAAPLAAWLSAECAAMAAAGLPDPSAAALGIDSGTPVGVDPAAASARQNGSDAPPARRAEDASARILKVDQEKIDRLMSLIGEMVVAKNGLPFLAARAESVYGVRDLAREIKSQYAVINRIAEEMQDAIMQVRMMPVSGVLQRFPRLVRDISRKLGKQVALSLEGEETEADKNIIEALADPLIHIVRNSLDHGIELPEVRRAAGKPAEGRLVIRAMQDSGRVLIDISDDGKGIDPAAIKRKAYEKGILDESALERISDQEAINLVFAAGFSTAETVSDLSGRGVGMDVVRNAVERVNGSVTLTSEVGKGTRLRLSLPLSMAVTNVMVIESNKQIFGVPMDMVLETVRIPRADIRSIKNRQTIVLRNRILPLRSLNELLAGDLPQVSNELDEMATLVVQIHGESLGIVVDNFREVVDIILKPMGGILNGIPGYSGSALLGDGSVLMVLNPKELVSWQ